MKRIAIMRTDFPDKFGLPRQSSPVSALTGKIIFEPEYQNPDALRGLEEFSHLWVIWEFSEMKNDEWSPTVRPPRLGGNKRMGVFATRSPNRPNPIGLSVVKIEKIADEPNHGKVIYVSGADMIDKTPIYDIKPYLPYVDCHPEASGGFSDDVKGYSLQVEFGEEFLEKIPKEKRDSLFKILGDDPRPGYHDDPERIYGMRFSNYEIKFRVQNETLYVTDVVVGFGLPDES